MLSASTRSSRRRRTLLGAAIGALFLIGMAQPAVADPYGDGSWGAGWLPDDRSEDWCFGSEGWANFYGDAAYMAAGTLDAQTNLTLTKRATCGAHTDIILHLFPGLGTRGMSWCATTPTNSKCDQWVVLIDPEHIRNNQVDPWGNVTSNTAPGTFEKNFIKTLCHEMGHTVGLKHSEPATGDDCMHSGDVSNGDFWQYTGYNIHHQYHVNTGQVAFE